MYPLKAISVLFICSAIHSPLIADDHKNAGFYDIDPGNPPRTVAWCAATDPQVCLNRTFYRLLPVLQRRHAYNIPTLPAYDKPDIHGKNPAGSCRLRGCDKNHALVAVSPQLFDITRNEEEFALVVAHELAHLKFGHEDARQEFETRAKDHDGGQEWEQLNLKLISDQERQADIEAVTYIKQAGYQCKKAQRLFRHIVDFKWAMGKKSREEVKKFFESVKSHDTPQEREKLFKKLCP